MNNDNNMNNTNENNNNSFDFKVDNTPQTTSTIEPYVVKPVDNNVNTNTTPEVKTEEHHIEEYVVKPVDTSVNTNIVPEVKPEEHHIEEYAVKTQNAVNQTPVQPVETATSPADVVSAQVSTTNAPVVNNQVEVNPTLPQQDNELLTNIDPNQKVVIDNTKKSTSNFVIFLLIILLGAAVFFIDDIITFVDENIISKNPTSVGKTESNNTLDGYILINENSAFIKLDKIKFYNFKTSGDNKILFNYESEKKYNDTSKLNVYLEIYNSDKELLYKELFNPNEKIESGTVRTYLIELGVYEFINAFYAKVVVNTEEELNKKTTLVCTYKKGTETDKYSLEYKNTYTFVNNMLSSYNITKSVSGENIDTYVSEMEKEKDNIDGFGIDFKYENNKLEYDIDLNNLKEGFIPMYPKGTTRFMIQYKDILKKWDCEE